MKNLLNIEVFGMVKCACKHTIKFYRQKPLGSYIADFYSRRAKLVIEIDGSQHYTEEGLEYDRIRTEYLNSRGLNVMRFTNYEIDHNFDEVCEKINAFIAHCGLTSLSTPLSL